MADGVLMGLKPREMVILAVGPYPSEKYDVNWDDDIPNGKIKVMFQSPPTIDLMGSNGFSLF